MKIGARVRRRSDNLLGVVVAVDEHRLTVETPDGQRRMWTESSVIVVERSYAPACLARASDRMRAAARRVAEGEDRTAVCADLGITRKQLTVWIKRVADADYDARSVRGWQS